MSELTITSPPTSVSTNSYTDGNVTIPLTDGHASTRNDITCHVYTSCNYSIYTVGTHKINSKEVWPHSELPTTARWTRILRRATRLTSVLSTSYHNPDSRLKGKARASLPGVDPLSSSRAWPGSPNTRVGGRIRAPALPLTPHCCKCAAFTKKVDLRRSGTCYRPGKSPSQFKPSTEGLLLLQYQPIWGCSDEHQRWAIVLCLVGVCFVTAAAKLYLSIRHVPARLNWSLQWYLRTMQQWSIVAFSDKASFTLRLLKNYARVWRREGTRYETQNMLPTFKSGFGSLSVWEMFTSRGRETLVHIPETLNQEKYINILRDYVLPIKNTHHPGNNVFLYQYDGSGPHRAKKLSLFLEAKGVYVLPWPAQSTDLNPIENIWAIMKHRLRKLGKYPTTAYALFVKFVKYGMHYNQSIALLWLNLWLLVATI